MTQIFWFIVCLVGSLLCLQAGQALTFIGGAGLIGCVAWAVLAFNHKDPDDSDKSAGA